MIMEEIFSTNLCAIRYKENYFADSAIRMPLIKISLPAWLRCMNFMMLALPIAYQEYKIDPL